MNFDLRLPIGILFSLFGVILTGYGFVTQGSEIYDKSLKHNINISWGIVLLVFGGVMLLLALRARKA
ncbi:MAG: hypothetical protein ABIS50_11680 [Luteolibacter sp.]|uniref:hypothetical protein n=1 Tax=Luteolibacter sp. TaxID=1962973 RepID=UPI003267B448